VPERWGWVFPLQGENQKNFSFVLATHKQPLRHVISKSDCDTIPFLPGAGWNHEWFKTGVGLAQGVGLLSTSLLGTGVFAVPALAALVAGDNSLWAWPALILLVFPDRYRLCPLGRHFPSAGGVAHFVIWLWPTSGASPAGSFYR
jgi:hypothetical protein